MVVVKEEAEDEEEEACVLAVEWKEWERRRSGAEAKL